MECHDTQDRYHQSGTVSLSIGVGRHNTDSCPPYSIGRVVTSLYLGSLTEPPPRPGGSLGDLQGFPRGTICRPTMGS
jgi:hypothetical protein